jgi:hypothetical protein
MIHGRTRGGCHDLLLGSSGLGRQGKGISPVAIMILGLAADVQVRNGEG